MTKRSPKKKTISIQLNRPPWVYCVFLFSGIASLIYQVVWVRMLTLGVWSYYLFRVDCFVSIYGGSWIGQLFVGKDD